MGTADIICAEFNADLKSPAAGLTIGAKIGKRVK